MKKLYTLTAILGLSAAVQAQSGLYGWGSSSWGALGNGATFGVVFSPARIGTANWLTIDAGLGYSVGIQADGTLWSWGTDSNEQLGNGTLTDATTPKQISTATQWQTLSCGLDHTVALKRDGSLWGWGNNIEGGLGTGNSNDVTTPTQIGGGTADWKAIAAGEHYTLAIKTNGTLWAWGDNNYGELGAGSTSDQYNPVQVGTGTDWQMVASGDYFSFGIKTNGTLWAWGRNSFGGANNSSPVQVGTGTDWKLVASHDDSHFAIKTDGTLWAWGDNLAGQLGIGNNTSTTVMTQVGTATDWLAVAPGTDHAVMLKKDHSLWGSGAGVMNGQTAATNVPAQIGTDSWSTIASGSVHAFALKGGTTGIGTTQVSNTGVRVYPNPATHFIQVATDNELLSLSLFNLQGQMVLQRATAEIDVTAMPEGMYLYRIVLKNGTIATGTITKK